MSQIPLGKATIDLELSAEQLRAELARTRGELDAFKQKAEDKGGMTSIGESAKRSIIPITQLRGALLSLLGIFGLVTAGVRGLTEGVIALGNWLTRSSTAAAEAREGMAELEQTIEGVKAGLAGGLTEELFNNRQKFARLIAEVDANEKASREERERAANELIDLEAQSRAKIQKKYADRASAEIARNEAALQRKQREDSEKKGAAEVAAITARYEFEEEVEALRQASHAKELERIEEIRTAHERAARERMDALRVFEQAIASMQRDQVGGFGLRNGLVNLGRMADSLHALNAKTGRR